MKKEILRLQDVTYKKQNTIIFRNMTFNILKGDIMGIIPHWFPYFQANIHAFHIPLQK